MDDIVHARYLGHAQAQEAVEALLEARVSPREVTVLVGDGASYAEFPISRRSRVWRDAPLGGGLGALLGGLLGLAQVVAVGAATGGAELLQMVVFGVLGGLIAGGLRGAGRWEQQVPRLAAAELRLAVRVGARSGADAAQVRAIFLRTGGCQLGSGRLPRVRPSAAGGRRPVAGGADAQERGQAPAPGNARFIAR